MRNRLVEELRADYVLLARSEGMGRAHIVLRQCLRNVLPSYLSLMAISVPHVMGGTYIVEAVFSYPGLGTLSYESARYKDYNLLMVLCLLAVVPRQADFFGRRSDAHRARLPVLRGAPDARSDLSRPCALQ